MKKCYKIDDSFKITCSNVEDKVIAYVESRIYSDDSNKSIEQECKDATPVCKDGEGCVAETGEIECNDMISCKDPSKVCKDNKCVDPDPTDNECDNISNKCSDGKLCLAGKCIVVKVDDPCDDSFKPVCSADRKILICDNKKVAEKDCATGMTCNDKADGIAECADSCSNSNKVGDIQYADCDATTNSAYNYVCSKDFYGNGLYAFETITACGSKKCSGPANKESGEEAVCK